MKSMRLLSFVLLLVFIHTICNAQKGTTTFSISYGDGKGQVKPIMAKAEMLGRYDEGAIRTFDIGLAGAIGKSTALEIGVSALNHQYQFTKYEPGLAVATSRSVNTLVFPVKLRVDILKYFFISGGFLLNANIGQERGLDLGVGIGAGIQYYFKRKYGVFIYPQTNIHTPTIGLSEQHVAFGLAYRIPKK